MIKRRPIIKMKIYPPKKQLSDYLTSGEIKFIKNHKDLINNCDWDKLIDEMHFGDTCLSYENMKAIIKFLSDTLPADVITYEEMMSKLDIIWDIF